MAMALPRSRPLTYADLQRAPDDGHRYELVDGVLLVTPAPNVPHQECSGRLFVLLFAAAGPELIVLAAPTDYKISESTALQPDLLVARRNEVGRQRVERAPLLVIEVLSPSTRLTDLGTKRLAYERAGVPAYWIVDPDVPSIVELRMEAGIYVERSAAAGSAGFSTDFPVALHCTPRSLVPES